MFFSIFWTAYIPMTLVILSLLWQRLVDVFHRKQARAQTACSKRPAIRRN